MGINLAPLNHHISRIHFKSHFRHSFTAKYTARTNPIKASSIWLQGLPKRINANNSHASQKLSFIFIFPFHLIHSESNDHVVCNVFQGFSFFFPELPRLMDKGYMLIAVSQ